jgi:Domain of unknown function (DUF4352)
MRKFIFILSSIILFSCGNNNNTSKNNTSENLTSNSSSKELIIGQTLSTDYFDITISDVGVGNRVNTNNQFTDIAPEKDNMFMVFFVKFKNTDNRSHYVDEGSILIDDNGKEFKFEKSESIMLEGWGVLLDELNPLTTLDTKIVYKLPKEIKGKVYWVSDDDTKIYLGDISNQTIRLSNEQPKEIKEEKKVEKVEVVDSESEGLPTEEDFKEEDNVAAAEIIYYKINDPDGYSNLRDDTSNGKIIRKVLESEKFEVLSTENGYKKVKLYDGTIGYIHSSRVVEY